MQQENARTISENSVALSNREFLALLRKSLPRALAYGFLGFFVVGVFLYMFVATVDSAEIRARASRARADIRSLAKGLEAYKLDNNTYPPGYPYVGPILSSLTTPVAYVPSLFEDSFNPNWIRAKTLQSRLRLMLRILLTFSVGLIAAFLALREFSQPAYPQRLNRFMNLSWLALIWTGLGVYFVLFLSPKITPYYFPSDVFGAPVLVFCSLIGALVGFGHGLQKGLGKAVWRPSAIGKTLVLVSACTFTMLLMNPVASELGNSIVRASADYEKSRPYFLYATDGQKGWLIWSRGPDFEPSIPADKIPGWLEEEISLEEMSVRLLGYTYDPTNGTVSPGDIWRTNQ